MQRILSILLGMLDACFIVIILVLLGTSVGYNLGYKAGVETKITLVGQRYIMRERGTFQPTPLNQLAQEGHGK